MYHLKCIDPWLTKNRRVCPVCKGKVVLPGMTDPTDSESEVEHTVSNERTPLVSNPRPSRWRRLRSHQSATMRTPLQQQQSASDEPSVSPANDAQVTSLATDNFPVTSGHFSVNCDEREAGPDVRDSSMSSATIAVVEVEPVPNPVRSSSARRSSRRSRRNDAIV